MNIPALNVAGFLLIMTAENLIEREKRIKEAEKYERIDEVKAKPVRERVARHMKNNGYIQEYFWAEKIEQQILWQPEELDSPPPPEIKHSKTTYKMMIET